MQKQIKVLLTVIIALFLAVSCAKNNPNNPNNQEISIAAGSGNRNYRFLADETILYLDWTDPRKIDYFTTNWMNTFTDQTIYSTYAPTIIMGYTDDKANYYAANYPNTVRDRFKFATNVTDNGKEYIGGVYYDEASKYGNLWRLIYITENGEEQAFYGSGANDPNTIPESWVKYSYFFGYIKIN
ncbi:hypothetical protein BHAMNSH16_14105 [Brachyspira hampsonii]|uniref:Lipoprotein n=3 Tax=Brachyspira hampsonii TaxID=1287055 RepID=A0AAC9TWM6_9SPIR|nr:hypothetical protein [Brachyspira hampsonii]ASJ22714.1 hypothetical protein BHAMNSH16_14105 [Brachyspira hampsonii]MBW5381463.1 hypothetical protein [Brachyspira hampsonii]OEJ19802.1 hypothetical protein A9496_03260 [Brachyspira hampsonii]